MVIASVINLSECWRLLAGWQAGGLRVKFGETEGTVLSVLSTDDDETALSLLVPPLTEEISSYESYGSVTVSIFSVWSPSQCNQCPGDVSFTTDGPELQIYRPIIPISVAPSRVRSRQFCSFYCRNY